MARSPAASGEAVAMLRQPAPPRRSRRSAPLRAPLTTVVATAAVIAGTLVGCSTDPPLVVLYGDSLASEAEQTFSDQLGGHARVRAATVPGAALCDVLDRMRDDLGRRTTPRLAVIQFSGNNVTPCVQDANGDPLEGDALADRYATDARRAIELFSENGVQLYLVGSPPTTVSSTAVTLNERYRALATEASRAGSDVSFVDAHLAVSAPDGSFNQRLPCLPFETVDLGCDGGSIVVRAPDGVHFCPTGRGDDRECPVWSSGAYRFGSAMAAPVLQELAGTTTTTPST